MKADLMGGIFELHQFPKRGTRYFSIYKVLDIIINGVIRHWPLHNIIRVCFSTAAIHNKIKPFLCHTFKLQIS